MNVVHERLEPRTVLPCVSHARTTEWVFCVKGSMVGVVDGRTHRLRAGSILLMPPGTRHRFITGRGSCEAISIFSPALALGQGSDIRASD